MQKPVRWKVKGKVKVLPERLGFKWIISQNSRFQQVSPWELKLALWVNWCHPHNLLVYVKSSGFREWFWQSVFCQVVKWNNSQFEWKLYVSEKKLEKENVQNAVIKSSKDGRNNFYYFESNFHRRIFLIWQKFSSNVLFWCRFWSKHFLEK